MQLNWRRLNFLLPKTKTGNRSLKKRYSQTLFSHCTQNNLWLQKVTKTCHSENALFFFLFFNFFFLKIKMLVCSLSLWLCTLKQDPTCGTAQGLANHNLTGIQSFPKFTLQMTEYYMTHIWFVDKRNHVSYLVLINWQSLIEQYETVRQAVLISIS